MKETSGDQWKSRHSVIAGLSVALLLSLAAGCRGGTEPAAQQTTAVEPSTTPISQPLPVATIAPVGRAELLSAAAAAADEVAGGNALPNKNLELVDRTFELRLPFACGGGINSEWGQWSIDPRTKVLRISVRPELRGDNQTVKALGAGLEYDAVEGFWLARPWTRSESCPSPLSPEVTPSSPAGIDAQAAGPDASPMHTFAIVQFFSPDAPRTLRRGARPYSYTGKLPEAETLGARGFRLKLTGRIRAYGDGQPIHCLVTSPARPPVCAAAVEFTQVVLEDGATGQSLAEWNS